MIVIDLANKFLACKDTLFLNDDTMKNDDTTKRLSSSHRLIASSLHRKKRAKIPLRP